VSAGAAPSLIYILEKFSNDLSKLEAIAGRVKKNFFESKTFKRR